MRALIFVVTAVSGLLASFPAAGYQLEIEALGRRIGERLAPLELEVVAVHDFTNLRGEVSELGRFLAEELSGALVAGPPAEREGRPRVVDRLQLGRVLHEMAFQDTGLVDPEKLREVGRLTGADALVTGRVTPLSDTLRLRIRVLDSRSGEELLADQADLPRTRSLVELERRSLSVVVGPGECGPIGLELEGPALRVLESDELEIALRGCVRAGESVHCLVDLTSRQNDRSVQLFGDSRLVLPDGRQLPATRVSVGTSTATGARGRAGEVLVEGVAVTATASFGPVPATVESIQILELRLHGDDAEFRDVPIDRP